MNQLRATELLEIELACVRRNESGACDRNCAVCDLVQETDELVDMYEYVINRMKSSDADRMPNTLSWRGSEC